MLTGMVPSVRPWKQTGEELDRVKWEELRALDESRSALIFNILAAGWVEDRVSRDHEPGQGLIIQQGCLSKAHATQRCS